ncbi:hypothetical protein [Neobacillus cucumis]|uniref:Uncharacterized protein n=1 Tax=Neobacillus cucumis TaxID=1740721 RepID=A0A2N5HLM6_9BACI|nr:hypothetical protein [Neobacillus cucumis]PLS06433.1 hypothetical protein CVD27_07775 [Neobacillus cucumis]
MKGIKQLYVLIFFILLASGCQREITKPEIKPKFINIYQSSVSVFHQDDNEIPSLFVKHEIKGNQIYIECLVTGISFRNRERSKQKIGKMQVWVDGKKSREITSAAFIIKGLSPGKHKLKLEIVKLNNEPYGLSKEIMVNIPR